MSEFKKRFPIPNFRSSCFTWVGQKDGWTECLKWTLSQRTRGIEEDGSISSSNIIHASDIEQELEAMKSE